MNHEVLKPKVKSTRDHSDKEGTNVKYVKYGQRVSMVRFIGYVWFILIISFIFLFIIFRLIYLSFIVLIITYHFPFWRSYHTYYDTEALKTAPLSMTRSYIDTAMVTPLPCWWQLVDKRMMLWNRIFWTASFERKAESRRWVLSQTLQRKKPGKDRKEECNIREAYTHILLV